MNDDRKRRILADITDAAKAATRADARLDDLFVQARLADASLREIATATDGRFTHQTIANRITAMRADQNGEPKMTVYVVTAGEYDDYSIESVHATPESAAKAVDAIKTSDRPSDIRDSATYQPWDVQA